MNWPYFWKQEPVAKIDKDVSEVLTQETLLNSKEKIDIAKIVNQPEYESLRSHFLKTVVMLQDSAASRDKDEAFFIIQFAKLLKDFVVDMDRMKIQDPDKEPPQDPYDP